MSFEPQNALEASLVKAADDPVHRPQFYRDLLAADVFIVQPPLPEGEGAEPRVTVSRGENIQIATVQIGDRAYVPIFSSLPRLQQVLTEPASYVRMPARAFLEMTLGSDLVLNPGSQYGKAIPADEARALLDGSLWSPTERYVVEKETSVILGQPARYPDALVAALTRVFKERREVKRAWVAHFHHPERGEPPHTLVCVEMDGDENAVFAAAGLVARDVAVPDPPVDFIRFAGKGVGEYFRKTKPFYQKRRFGFF